MREISKKNQEIIDEAKIYGLDLNYLRQLYGLKFVIKLFKYLKRKSMGKVIYPIHPSQNSGSDYIDELEDAGFILKKWTEDFIDEDTGEIVLLKRFIFKPLKRKK